MTLTKQTFMVGVACACALTLQSRNLAGQAEVLAWGSVPGIRVEGQLMPVGGTVCALEADGKVAARTARERQRPSFTRDAGGHTVTSAFGTLSFTERVTDVGRGAAAVELTFRADSASARGGAFCIDLPRASFPGARVELVGATGSGSPRMARGLRLVAGERRLEIDFARPALVILRPAGNGSADAISVSIGVLPARSPAGSSATNRFTIRSAGSIDHSPVTLTLRVDRPGRVFDGLGGNFRIQNPTLDPKVIAYNLENMRVAWGRVEMPWRYWEPEESADPAEVPRAGRVDDRVVRAMEMARDLGKRKIPVIVSVWFPPAWAVEGELHSRPVNGVWGNALDPEKMERIYASITSYLLYLKSEYGVEAALFSFNESNLGIDVRQTGEEHAAFIRGLGAYMAAHGLATKMLLGDTADATDTTFIAPAMKDRSTWQYIGAVSFHSWRGWSDDLLTFWGNAGKTLNVPLLVGEGSTDAAAWNYPAVFQEPWFAMEEIDLYTRILSVSEPMSILQWQLTADYSVLAGGGVFRDGTELRPTQRFWNLKQLASTPPASFILPASCDREDVTCAALGDIARGEYTLHVVNNGAARSAEVSGLPEQVAELRVFVTDATRGMREGARVPVSNGRATVALEPTSFTTLRASVANR
jgi:hypothetical protein